MGRRGEGAKGEGELRMNNEWEIGCRSAKVPKCRVPCFAFCNLHFAFCFIPKFRVPNNL